MGLTSSKTGTLPNTLPKRSLHSFLCFCAWIKWLYFFPFFLLVRNKARMCLFCCLCCSFPQRGASQAVSPLSSRFTHPVHLASAAPQQQHQRGNASTVQFPAPSHADRSMLARQPALSWLSMGSRGDNCLKRKEEQVIPGSCAALFPASNACSGWKHLNHFSDSQPFQWDQQCPQANSIFSSVLLKNEIQADYNGFISTEEYGLQYGYKDCLHLNDSWRGSYALAKHCWFVTDSSTHKPKCTLRFQLHDQHSWMEAWALSPLTLKTPWRFTMKRGICFLVISGKWRNNNHSFWFSQETNWYIIRVSILLQGDLGGLCFYSLTTHGFGNAMQAQRLALCTPQPLPWTCMCTHINQMNSNSGSCW